MSSELLTKSFIGGKVVVRRRRHVAGEIMLSFHGQHDNGLNAIIISTDDPVVLTDKPGVTIAALQRSNLRQLIAFGHLEVVHQA